MKNKNLSGFLAGCKAAIPVILGFIPAGIAYAIMARQAGFSIGQTCLMSLTVFAGAAQMMAAGMYAQGAGIITMIITTFIVNLRHLIMSTCVFTRMKPARLWLRVLASFGVTDEGFAIFTTEKEENCTVFFLFGLLVVTYLSWNVGTLIGALVSEVLPPIINASLAVSLYAMFIGLLMPNLKGNFRLVILVILTAISNTILTQFLASSWALVISTLLGAFVGVFFVDLNESTDRKEESHES